MIFLILGALFMLGLSIFVHELGHYLLAKAVGIRAEIFSIGYGKGIWKKKINETTWQITAIPLGGYVKFYGDEYGVTSTNDGTFYGTPPLKRIIPVLGGPLFNLILGIIIFFILHSISGPLAPKVYIWEEIQTETPAYRGGIRTGDVVLNINGVNVKDFNDIHRLVSLSAGAPLKFMVRRNNETKEFTVNPMVDPSGISYVGLRPPGERYIEVDYPLKALWGYRLQTLFSEPPIPRTLKAMPYLNEGDVILSVEGIKPGSITELQKILGEHHGKNVKIKVKRESLPWLMPWITHEETLTIPTTGEYRVDLTSLTDMKYKEKISNQILFSNSDDHVRALASIKINGESVGSFEQLSRKFSKPEEGIQLSVAGNFYQANIQTEKIGLLGFRAMDRYENFYLDQHTSLLAITEAAFTDVKNNIMIYPTFFRRLFSGRLSFMDNARGPVGMVAIAGVVFKSGIREYLQLFGAISIALMVMNLLPLPVVDGGHIVFFLYEAIAGKPIPLAVMENIYRFGFSLLLFLGLWIMWKDILFVSSF